MANGKPVACPPAARERGPEGQAKTGGIGATALAAFAPVGLGLLIAGGESWADPAIVSPNGLPVQVNPTFPEPGLPPFNFPQGRLFGHGGVASAVTIGDGSGTRLWLGTWVPMAARVRGCGRDHCDGLCRSFVERRHGTMRRARAGVVGRRLHCRRGLPARRSRARPTSRSAR